MSKTAYIQLIRGQEYLFTDPKYDVGKKNVVYNLTSLQTDKIYNLSFENMPKDRNTSLDKNVTTQSKNVLTASNDSGSTATINTKSASGVIEEVQGKVLLAYPFRTSMYATLTEKLASNKVEGSYFSDINGKAYSFSARIAQPKEAYDASELNADQNLISFEVNFKSHTWFTDKLKGYVYQNYPVLNNFRVDRDTALLGFIPTRDVATTQTLPMENLNDQEIGSGSVNLTKSTYTLTGYFHGTMYKDYQHIKSQVANLASKGIPVGNYGNMLTDTYAGINRTMGFVYPVEVYYHLPWEPKKRKVGVINVRLD